MGNVSCQFPCLLILRKVMQHCLSEPGRVAPAFRADTARLEFLRVALVPLFVALGDSERALRHRQPLLRRFPKA
jgi:hypothetical protein